MSRSWLVLAAATVATLWLGARLSVTPRPPELEDNAAGLGATTPARIRPGPALASLRSKGGVSLAVLAVAGGGDCGGDAVSVLLSGALLGIPVRTTRHLGAADAILLCPGVSNGRAGDALRAHRNHSFVVRALEQASSEHAVNTDAGCTYAGNEFDACLVFGSSEGSGPFPAPVPWKLGALASAVAILPNLQVAREHVGTSACGGWPYVTIPPGGDATRHWCSAARATLAAAHARALRRLTAPSPPGFRTFFVTYSDAAYERSQRRLHREALASGVFAACFSFEPKHLLPSWAAARSGILSRKRGGGYWVWKAHLALRVMREHMVDGDILMFIDAGSTIRAPPTRYAALAAEHGALIFQQSFFEAAWTKRALFEALDIDTAVFGQLGQLLGGIWALRRDATNLFLLAQWDEINTDARLVTDDVVPGVANEAGFHEHRHDQSSLSLLVRKYGMRTIIDDETDAETAQVIAATRLRGPCSGFMVATCE